MKVNEGKFYNEAIKQKFAIVFITNIIVFTTSKSQNEFRFKAVSLHLFLTYK